LGFIFSLKNLSEECRERPDSSDYSMKMQTRVWQGAVHNEEDERGKDNQVSRRASEELKVLFDKLSEGAEVTDPLQAQFFGTYGALTDKFGVRWMFHSNPNA
jgi:uncharacterized glyoxalase superfamily protein PhnB